MVRYRVAGENPTQAEYGRIRGYRGVRHREKTRGKKQSGAKCYGAECYGAIRYSVAFCYCQVSQKGAGVAKRGKNLGQRLETEVCGEKPDPENRPIF
jgi:hypothetical protein